MSGTGENATGPLELVGDEQAPSCVDGTCDVPMPPEPA